MTIDQLRLEFEAREIESGAILTRCADGNYLDSAVQGRWEACRFGYEAQANCTSTQERGEAAALPADGSERDRLVMAMALAYENSSAHDLIGPMEDAYSALLEAIPAHAGRVAEQPFAERELVAAARRITELEAQVERMREALALVRMSGGWHLMTDESREVIKAALAAPQEQTK